jgi:hypothetical protein
VHHLFCTFHSFPWLLLHYTYPIFHKSLFPILTTATSLQPPSLMHNFPPTLYVSLLQLHCCDSRCCNSLATPLSFHFLIFPFTCIIVVVIHITCVASFVTAILVVVTPPFINFSIFFHYHNFVFESCHLQLCSWPHSISLTFHPHPSPTNLCCNSYLHHEGTSPVLQFSSPQLHCRDSTYNLHFSVCVPTVLDRETMKNGTAIPMRTIDVTPMSLLILHSHHIVHPLKVGYDRYVFLSKLSISAF